MKLIKDMNKEEMIVEFNQIMLKLKNMKLDNDERFLLENRASRLEKKLSRKYNYNIRG